MAEFRRHRRYRHKETTKRKKYDEQEVSLFKMGKRQLMLVLISVFAVVIAAVGTSFAIFTTSVKSSDYNVIVNPFLKCIRIIN